MILDLWVIKKPAEESAKTKATYTTGKTNPLKAGKRKII